MMPAPAALPRARLEHVDGREMTLARVYRLTSTGADCGEVRTSILGAFARGVWGAPVWGRLGGVFGRLGGLLGALWGHFGAFRADSTKSLNFS